MIKILRPVEIADGQLSARSFEHHFQSHVGAGCTMRLVATKDWVGQIAGPGLIDDLDSMTHRFTDAVGDADFICPSNDAMQFAALQMALRNRARSRCRFLFLAICSAHYTPHWALLRPLFRPGDRIVAPTENARHLLKYLCPELLPYVRLVPLPVRALPGRRERGRVARPTVTSICRIFPPKLVHRQIEALGIMKARGWTVPLMNVVGPTRVAETGFEPTYVASLAKLIRRCGLNDYVRFHGAVWDRNARGALMEATDVFINLSAYSAETTSQAATEAQSVGVPLLATRWAGFVDLPREVGALVPVVMERRDTVSPTASAYAVADQLASLLEDPPDPEACRAYARGFAPEITVPQFVAMCDEAMTEVTSADGFDAFDRNSDEPAAPSAGLLSTTAPLTEMSWTEFFGFYERWVLDDRRIADKRPPAWKRLFRTLAIATLPAAMRQMAQPPFAPPPEESTRGCASPPVLDPENIFERGLRGTVVATVESRQACLRELRSDHGDAALAYVETFGPTEPARADVAFVRVEAHQAIGATADAYATALAALRLLPPDEAEVLRFEQLFELAQAVGQFDHAISELIMWLDRYPLSIEAGKAWLLLAECHARSAPPRVAEARAALNRAATFTVSFEAVERVERLLLGQSTVGNHEGASALTLSGMISELETLFAGDLRAIALVRGGESQKASSDVGEIVVVANKLPIDYLCEGLAFHHAWDQREGLPLSVFSVEEWRSLPETAPAQSARLRSHLKVLVGLLEDDGVEGLGCV